MEKHKWIEVYIAEILADIQCKSYKRRAAKELANHLLDMIADLTAQGYDDRSAQNEAMLRLGNKAVLQAQYKRASQQAKRAGGGYYLQVLCKSCLLIGGLYIAIFIFLAGIGFSYDRQPGIALVGNGLTAAFFGAALFFIPFSLGAVYLSHAFGERINRRRDALSVLLAVWLFEKLAIVTISGLIYGYGFKFWQAGDFFSAISTGGNETAPWFTVGYIFSTLAGCILFGFLTKLTPPNPTRRKMTNFFD